MAIFVYDDGGRSKYFKAANVRDCVVRAIAIAGNFDYMEIYKMVKFISGKTPRNGVEPKATKQIMKYLGYKWVPCMKVGSGCKVHLKADELPKGRIICNCSGHVVAVIDGVVHDTHDCTRNGTMCVYGYWIVKQ